MLFNSEKEHKKYMRKIYKLSELYYQYKLEENNRICILKNCQVHDNLLDKPTNILKWLKEGKQLGIPRKTILQIFHSVLKEKKLLL